MTVMEHAKFIRTVTLLVGLSFIGTILFAPIGIWIIRWGEKQIRHLFEQAMKNPHPSAPLIERAMALGVATSWDDLGPYGGME